MLFCYVRCWPSIITECSGVADVVLLIDESTSVGKSNFHKVKLFVANVLNGLDIGNTVVQVGCLTFSDKVTDRFDVNRYDTILPLTTGIVYLR